MATPTDHTRPAHRPAPPLWAGLLEEVYSQPFYTLLDIPIAYGIDIRFYSTIKMRIGRNTCQWLTSSSTEHCSKRCMSEYCGVHLDRLRKGGGTKACIQCGKGVYNKFTLCKGCGYETIMARDWQQKQRSFTKEFKRLAVIELL